MGAVIARVGARVGLLGNPSDIYGGRALGFGLASPGARATLTPRSGGGPQLEGELLQATWRAFARELRTELAGEPGRRGGDFELSVACDVPFQSGLSGSSAIVIAALRALAAHFGRSLAPHRLAELAWWVETRELGVLAGPLDRLVQAHGGLVFMDCARPFEAGAVTALDPGLLPPLLVAWNPDPGRCSGAVHEPVHARWRRGDREVLATMEQLAALADRGREALEQGDRGRLAELIDRNFELRASLFPIDPADRRLVELGRAAGAAVKFCGSGGSVVALPREGRLEALRAAYLDAGCGVLLPEVGAGAEVAAS